MLKWRRNWEKTNDMCSMACYDINSIISIKLIFATWTDRFPLNISLFICPFTCLDHSISKIEKNIVELLSLKYIYIFGVYLLEIVDCVVDSVDGRVHAIIHLTMNWVQDKIEWFMSCVCTVYLCLLLRISSVFRIGQCSIYNVFYIPNIHRQRQFVVVVCFVANSSP